jgi:hypothetical protein
LYLFDKETEKRDFFEERIFVTIEFSQGSRGFWKTADLSVCEKASMVGVEWIRH